MDHDSRSAPPAASTRMVDVLVPVALDQTYSYKVPRGMEPVSYTHLTLPTNREV